MDNQPNPQPPQTNPHIYIITYIHLYVLNTQVYIATLNDKSGFESRMRSTEFGGNRNDMVLVRCALFVARALVSLTPHAKPTEHQ